MAGHDPFCIAPPEPPRSRSNRAKRDALPVSPHRSEPRIAFRVAPSQRAEDAFRVTRDEGTVALSVSRSRPNHGLHEPGIGDARRLRIAATDAPKAWTGVAIFLRWHQFLATREETLFAAS